VKLNISVDGSQRCTAAGISAVETAVKDFLDWKQAAVRSLVVNCDKHEEEEGSEGGRRLKQTTVRQWA
jgi:hypothetical protein